MAETYLITFKPVGRFYFGTSNSFADSFFPRSSQFPTQATLLGCLRHTLLKQNGLLDDKLKFPKEINDKVKSLTGESTMQSIKEIKNENYFGIIKKISTVFICHQPEGHLFPQNFYFPVPYDVIFKRDPNKRDKNGEKLITGIEAITFSNSPGNIDCFSVNKRTKEYSADLFGGDIFWNSYLNHEEFTLLNTIKTDDIFIEDSQPGISRDEDRKTIPEKYYFKKDFRLKKDFSFGTIVHFNSEPPLTDDDIFFGGERSLYKMRLTKIDDKNKGVISSHIIMKKLADENYYGDFDGSKEATFEEGDLLTFLSPFFAEGTLGNVKHSVINEIYSPRMLGYKQIKTNTFNVIPSRSVLYPSGKLSVDKSFPIPRLIGYNFALKFRRGNK